MLRHVPASILSEPSKPPGRSDITASPRLLLQLPLLQSYCAGAALAKPPDPETRRPHGGLYRRRGGRAGGLYRRLRHRRAARLQRHCRRRGELQLSRSHQPRLFHSHAVRAARGRGRSAVLSRADGASGEPRHHLPAAGEEPRRADPGPARRAAGGDRHLSRRLVDSPAERGACRSAGRSAGAAASGRRGFSDAARERAFGRRLAAALRRMRRPRR